MKFLFILSFFLIAIKPASSQTNKLSWAGKFSSTNDCWGGSIARDRSGNIITEGGFRGTTDFDPGPGQYKLTSIGANYDFYISKLNSSGNFLWAKRFGNNLYNNYPGSIATDRDGNIFLSGAFEGTFDFDPGIDSFKLTASGTCDIFILKLDSMGNFKWAKQMGGSLFDVAWCLEIDTLGNLYAAGEFNGTADFDPDSGTFNLTSAGKGDLFVVKLGPNGNFIWAKSIGGINDETWLYIAMDKHFNIYLTGEFDGSISFHTSTGISNLVSNGSGDIFVFKLDSSGNVTWARSFGGIDSDGGSAIVADTSGNVFVTGGFRLTVDFDPGPGVVNLISKGSMDIFILKLNSLGQFKWVKQIGGIDPEAGAGIELDNSGNIYSTGVFDGNAIDFDPGAGIYTLSTKGSQDIYILKLDSSGDFNWVYQIGGVDQDYIGDINIAKDGSVFLSGSFRATVDFDPGPATNNLTALGSPDAFLLNWGNCQTQSSVSITECDSFIFNGQTLRSSGNYTKILSNTKGCDSTITLHLTLKNTSSTITQTSCNSFKLNNRTYTSTGIYYQTLANAAGCDSLITINLTIYSLTKTVSKSGAVLTSDDVTANYQWVRCPGYSVIINATNRIYAPTNNGDYAVILTKNGCIDTSDCISVANVGMDDPSSTEIIKLVPNPSNGLFEIQSDNLLNNRYVEIYNSIGQLVYKNPISSFQNKLDLTKEPKGFYFVKIISEEQTISTCKIILKQY